MSRRAPLVRGAAARRALRVFLPCLALLATGCASDVRVARIHVEPTQAEVEVGGTRRIAAIVTGHEDATVTWDLFDLEGRRLASAGTVAPDGTLTVGPEAPDEFLVRATSVADPFLFASCRVHVSRGPGGQGVKPDPGSR